MSREQKTEPKSRLVNSAQIRDRNNAAKNRLARFIASQARLQVVPDRSKEFSAEQLDPRHFENTEEGSGAFGRWVLDHKGLPAYSYEMDQRTDARAYYVTSEGLNRQEHWHQIGNNRITGLAMNDGNVEVFLADKGGLFLNWVDYRNGAPPANLFGFGMRLVGWAVNLFRTVQQQFADRGKRKSISPRASLPATMVANQKPVTSKNEDAQKNEDTDQFAFGGGFGYLKVDEEIWSTAFRYSPKDAITKRLFGIGYFKTETSYHDILSSRHVYAPQGTDSVLLVDVEITNQRSTPVKLQYYEYWDVNVRQLNLTWLRYGPGGVMSDRMRKQINHRFSYNMTWDSPSQTLRFHQEPDGGPKRADEQDGQVDREPPNVFLTCLEGNCQTFYIDKSTFFGQGRAAMPDAVRNGDAGLTSPLDGAARSSAMPYCMVLRHDHTLQPGETLRLRFAYGAAEKDDQTLDYLQKYRHSDQLDQTLETWKDRLAYFSTGHDPILQRETAWHAYYLLSATLYSKSYDTYYTPQGSAYLYLHGADGVPRDQALFTIPLIYIDPDLARGTLKLMMSLQNAETLAIPYSFAGNGYVNDGLGFHAFPSDLDLFFLFAITEYVAATAHYEFLQAEIPFYPKEKRPTRVAGLTVLDHIRAAFLHLHEDVGVGPNGLLRIGDGDWDDAIVLRNALSPLAKNDLQETIRAGETIPNTQMALYVLPRVANLLKAYDAELSAQISEFVAKLKAVFLAENDPNVPLLNRSPSLTDPHRTDVWFSRALLRKKPHWIPAQGVKESEVNVIGDHVISLQSQPWALISNLAGELGIEDKLIDTIAGQLDDPSPTGAMLEPKGAVWPAVSQLLTWGYRRSRPDLAWRSLNRHTFAAHANEFPNIWFNIWTGPDGTNGKFSPNPGGTWGEFPLTPMTDFPAMNSNQHAMALMALLRVCGIEPSLTSDGLEITLKAPPDRYVLKTRLIELSVEPGYLKGEYHPIANGSIAVCVTLPTADPVGVAAVVDGNVVEDLDPSAQRVNLTLQLEVNRSVTFEVRWEV